MKKDEFSRPNPDAIEMYEGVQKSQANWMGRTFLNTDTNISVKSEYNRTDYNWYRPSEMVGHRQEQVIAMCMTAYDRVGIVKNTIDLMSDFAAQGINLVHPNKQIERFYQKWFKKIKGKDRAERFLNMLYRCGNVVVRRFNGKLPGPSIDEWKKAYGADKTDIETEFKDVKVSRNVIPAKYVFYNPLTVEVVGGELGAFIGKPIIGLKITPSLRDMLTRYGSMTNVPEISSMYESVPAELTTAIKNGARYMPLDQENVDLYHYKKDDWLVWATPLTGAVLPDLIHLEKLKLADSSALDGAISNIRLWNLGHLDGVNSIFPTRAAIVKLRNILANNVGGGTLDLVWGPELKFSESNTQIYHFLGPEKFIVTLNNIYTGMGIPPSMTGSSKDGGFTNNYMSIKTLVERLEYGRDVLRQWLTQEIERVQEAMGFRFPAQIVFDQMIMSDEAAEKALLVQLVDRNIISADTVRGKFDIPSDIEKVRIKRDHDEQGNTMPPKASQFHNPDKEHDMQKLLVQRGNVTPSQVGMDLPPPKDGEQTPNEQQHQQQMELADKNNQAKLQQQKYKPAGPNGRPKNAKDSSKRKKKRVLPRTKAMLDVWTMNAQKQIADIVTDPILRSYDKPNVRSLTTEETEQFETVKFDVLCACEPFEPVSEEKVYNILTGSYNRDSEIYENYHGLLADFIDGNQRKPNAEESRQLKAFAYTMKYELQEIEDENEEI